MIPGGVLARFVLFFAMVGAHVGAALHVGRLPREWRLPLQQLPRPGEPIIFLQLVAYTCSYIPDVDNRGIGRRLPLHNSPVLESLSSTKMDNEKNRNSFLMKCPYQYLEFLTRDLILQKF